MLVIVFDPLAIALLIASQSIGNDKKENDNLNVNGNKLVEKLNKIKESVLNHTNKLSSAGPNSPPSPVNKDVEEEKNEEVLEEKFEDVKPEVEEKKQELEQTQGGFEKYYEAQINNMSKYKEKFEELLRMLYDNGTVKAGENLLNFIDFKNKIDEMFEQKFSNEEIKRFLAVCNYLKITSLNEGERKALVDFEEAKKTLGIFYNNK